MKDTKVKKYAGGKQKMSVNLYGIDIDVGEKQIQDRLHEVLEKQPDTDGVEVKALRPLRGGRQAATIIANEDVIEKLIEMRKVKIGFSIADVRERKIIARCNRCWEPGHMAKECKSEDRSKKCRNCTSEDHMVKDCAEKPYCLTCKVQGHRTASEGCGKEKRKTDRGRL